MMIDSLEGNKRLQVRKVISKIEFKKLVYSSKCELYVNIRNQRNDSEIYFFLRIGTNISRGLESTKQ